MKSELYSPMKPDLSRKGLSEIMEQSYKDELESSKYELAKLSNEEFLSQYLQLNNNRGIISEYKYLLETPSCEFYKKFDYNQASKKDIFRKQIKTSIQNGVKKTINYFTKQELKALATKKLEQSVEKQKLSTSRKQKRETFYQTLRSSRKKQEKKDMKNQTSSIKQQPSQISKFQSPKKSVTVEQSIEDLFLRLQVVGQSRDRIKKKWYGWGQKGKFEEKRPIIEQWSANHQLMKNLLESLLQRLNRQIGTVQVFNQLKMSNQNSILQGLSSRSPSKMEKDKSLVSTRIDKNLRSEQIKMIYRFGSWFNKLLLDQRQIEYIQNLKRP